MSTIQHGWPFATGPGQIVTSHDWETMARLWQQDGVDAVPETLTTPSATNQGLYAKRLNNAQVAIQPGVAHIGGHFFELKVTVVFDIDISGTVGFDAFGIRRDLLTLRLDRSASSFSFAQVKASVDVGNGNYRLDTPGDEIPLVQLDISLNQGLLVEPVDRRWFVSRYVRPLKGGGDLFIDPAPRDGELGVDTVGNRLVVGQNGQWVSAKSVFTNDTDQALADYVTELQGKVATLESKVSTLQSDLDAAESTLNTAQGDIDVLQSQAVDDSFWQNITMASGIQQDWDIPRCRRLGKVVYLRGRFQNVQNAALTNGRVLGTLPSGFRPPDTYLMLALTYGSGVAQHGTRISINNSNGNITIESETGAALGRNLSITGISYLLG